MLTAARVRGDTDQFEAIATRLSELNPLEVEKQRPMAERRAREKMGRLIERGLDDLELQLAAGADPDPAVIAERVGMTRRTAALFVARADQVIAAKNEQEQASKLRELRNVLARRRAEDLPVDREIAKQEAEQLGLEADGVAAAIEQEVSRHREQQSADRTDRRRAFSAAMDRKLTPEQPSFDPVGFDPALEAARAGVSDPDERAARIAEGTRGKQAAIDTMRTAANDRYVRETSEQIADTAVNQYLNAIRQVPEFTVDSNPWTVKGGFKQTFKDLKGKQRTVKISVDELNRRAYEQFISSLQFQALGDPNSPPHVMSDAQKDRLLAYWNDTGYRSPHLISLGSAINQPVPDDVTPQEFEQLNPRAIRALDYFIRVPDKAAAAHLPDGALHAFRMTRAIMRHRPEFSTAQAFVAFATTDRDPLTGNIVLDIKEPLEKLLKKYNKKTREHDRFQVYANEVMTALRLSGVDDERILVEESKRIIDADTAVLGTNGHRQPIRGIENHQMLPEMMALAAEWYVEQNPETDIETIDYEILYDTGVVIQVDPTSTEILNGVRLDRQGRALMAAILNAEAKKREDEITFAAQQREFRRLTSTFLPTAFGAVKPPDRTPDEIQPPTKPPDAIQELFDRKDIDLSRLPGRMTVEWILSRAKQIREQRRLRREREGSIPVGPAFP